MPASEKIGKIQKILERLRSLFRGDRRTDTSQASDFEEKSGGGFFSLLGFKKNNSNTLLADKDVQRKKNSEDEQITQLSPLQKFALDHLGPRLPRLTALKEAYEQAGLPLVFESYLSTAFLLSLITAVFAAAASLVIETRVLRSPVLTSSIGSTILAFVAFAISFLLWLLYPLQRRRAFKAKLDQQLAYSFGVLGALSASGIGVERLFERLAASETNPVLSSLARRFLRDVKVFGLDTESALHEVAIHSPSRAFSKMLESMAVAYRTTGSMQDLVTFESARLFSEKKDKLKKNVGDLAIMAELYITLVVVGPIIFIVMLTIFLFLPTSSSLPNPSLLINLLVFLGIPSISAGFIIMLDSLVARL